MRNASRGADLPPIEFEYVPLPAALLPVAIVIVTEGEPAWLAVDAAQSALDDPADRAALALALGGA